MKKILSVILTGIFAFGVLTAIHGASGTETSNANVTFTPGNGPTSSVDPDNLTDLGLGENVEGSLVVVSISDFDFGVIPYSVAAIHQPIAVERPNIQTVDLRGVGSGWNLTAQLGEFQNEDSQPTLLGAAITIKEGNAISEFALPAPVNATNISLVAGSDQPTEIISAAADAGIGLWVMRWYPQDGGEKFIHLDIPLGKAAVGVNTAEIVWTLADGP